MAQLIYQAGVGTRTVRTVLCLTMRLVGLGTWPILTNMQCQDRTVPDNASGKRRGVDNFNKYAIFEISMEVSYQAYLAYKSRSGENE